MKTDPYFLRVVSQTPTEFWINNPTRRHAELAIKNGARGCTNNPSYSHKMIENPEEAPYALAILEQVLCEAADDNEAAEMLQRRLVKPIADRFMPMFEKSGGIDGFVSIQGDPIHEDDPDVVIRDAVANRQLSPNICCKVPTTTSGLTAMECLIEEDTPINATEIFGVSQMIAICEKYNSISHRTGKKPMFYMSHIAGIFDDYFRNYVAENQVDISPDVLWQAGLAVARKVYALMEERGYPAKFIGGGARGLHHFTEMVGGTCIITINWEGTADRLIEQDPPVVYRLFNPVPEKVTDELMEKLPDFRRAYSEDGLSVEEFEHFGPVQLFRSSFINSWQRVLSFIQQHRARLRDR